MLNITVLENFPKDLWQDFKELYNKKYKGVQPKEQWSHVHLADTLDKNDTEYFTSRINALGLDTNDIVLYTVSGPRRMAPHIDRGRSCAIQIPVDIDVENNYTFAINTDDYEHLVKKDFDHLQTAKDITDIVNVKENYFYYWDPLYYDTYNLEYPILQNVSVPHGGHNITNTTRRFFSLTIKDISYEDAKEIIKQWI